MQLYAPTSTTPKRKAVRAPALASIDGLRLGILENGKLNAEEMLNEVAQLFVQRNGCIIQSLASKRNASARRTSFSPTPSAPSPAWKASASTATVSTTPSTARARMRSPKRALFTAASIRRTS